MCREMPFISLVLRISEAMATELKEVDVKCCYYMGTCIATHYFFFLSPRMSPSVLI
jgi:hypothetical protein